MTRFHEKWQPSLVEEEVLAKGEWHYQGHEDYSIVLIRQKYDYTSFDLPLLAELLHPYFEDYIDYAISDDGCLYFCRFSNNKQLTTSPTFSTYFSARDHLSTYEGPKTIEWLQHTP